MITKKKSYKVGVDIDGVIWELLTPWLERYNKITNEKIYPAGCPTYSLKPYVKHPEILYYILEISDFWENIELYKGVKEAIDVLLNDPRIDLHIVTATSYKYANAKLRHLFHLLPSLQEKHITITQRKDLLNLDFLIDDCEDNFKHMVTSQSGQPILITQPYNKSFPAKQYNIIRCNNLCEAVDIIEVMLNEIETGGMLN